MRERSANVSRFGDRRRSGVRTPREHLQEKESQYERASRGGKSRSRTPSRYNQSDLRSEGLESRGQRMPPYEASRHGRSRSRTPTNQSRRTPSDHFYQQGLAQEIPPEEMEMGDRTPSRKLHEEFNDDFQLRRSRTPSQIIEKDSNDHGRRRREEARNRRKSQLLKKKHNMGRNRGRSRSRSKSRSQNRSRTPSRYSQSQHQSHHIESSKSSHQPSESQQNLDQSVAQSRKSNMTQSTYTGQELICDACVNKTLMQERKERENYEKQKDKMYQEAMMRKIQKEKQKEREKEVKKKQRFMKEAKDHWDLTRQMKEAKKQQEQEENKVYSNLMFEDDFRFKKDKMKQMQNRDKLRNDLKNQIREKTREKKRRMNQARNEKTLTGYPIGGEYVDRYSKMKNKHIDELRQQIEEKKKRKEEDKKVKYLLLF